MCQERTPGQTRATSARADRNGCRKKAATLQRTEGLSERDQDATHKYYTLRQAVTAASRICFQCQGESSRVLEDGGRGGRGNYGAVAPVVRAFTEMQLQLLCALEWTYNFQFSINALHFWKRVFCPLLQSRRQEILSRRATKHQALVVSGRRGRRAQSKAGRCRDSNSSDC